MATRNEMQDSDHRSQNTKVIASVSDKETENVPIINFEIKGIKVSGLLDTGGAVSLISADLFQKLKENNVKFTYLGHNIRIQSFSGTRIPFTHCIQLAFKLQNAFTTGTFYVTENNFNASYNMLCGYDYLKSNQMILDLEKKQLKFKNVKITLSHSGNKSSVQDVNIITSEQVENIITKKKRKKSDIFVKLVHKIYIPAGQEKIVSLLCPDFIEEDSMVLFEPDINNSGIECYHSVHEVPQNKIINVIAKNCSDKKIILQKGRKFGNLILEFDFEMEEVPQDIIDGSVHKINSLSIEEIHKLREAEITPEDFDLTHLPKDLQEKVERLLMQHTHAFSKSYKTLGQTDLVSPQIKLAHDHAIQCKPYKTPHAVREYAQTEIRKLLEANIIEKSTSSYAFPVLFVKKKTAENQELKYRMAVDYRLLNAILEGYAYPIPDIRELLQKISGKKYFTVLDLHSAFFQINLQPQDREKLAFITEYGKFQPVRMNFGLKISPTTFAELMDLVLGDFNKEEVTYYIDDVLIASNSVERMLTLITEVLQKLIDTNLTIEPKKMQICKQEIEFLGFRVHEDGYSPSKKNIEKIQKLARPKTKKGVKSLLGLANYFRSLIHKYSEIVDPLVQLTKEKVKFNWTEEAEKAFLAIQEAIVQNPTLKAPNFDKEFFLITDASKKALSAILAQKQGENFVPIEFYGRKLKDSEKKYPSIKYELLAIHDACVYFQNFLLGKKFTILTDSKALTEHLKLEKQSDIIARWLMRLGNFDYEIGFIPGEENPADFVSRNINNITALNELQNELFKVNSNLCEEKVREAQKEDTKLNLIIQKIVNNKQNRHTKKFELNDKNVLILKQRYKDKPLMIAPNKLIFEIIQEAHKAHFGFPKTYELVKSRFYWFGMYRDIKNYCAACIPCNKNKQHKMIKVPLQKVEKDHIIGSVVHLDIVGKLPLTLKKHCYILTIIDVASRFLQAFPLRNVETQTILNCITNYFSVFGLFREAIVDNAKYFRGNLFKEFMKAVGVNPHFCTTYKPSSNGILEVTHKELKSSISAMANSTTEWDIRLPFFILSHNTSIHRALGYRPDKLFFARETANHFTALEKPDILCTQKFVQKRIDHAKEVYKTALANQERIAKEYVGKDFEKITRLEIGDQVYLKNIGRPLVFHPKFDGPFEVIDTIRNNNYLLKHMCEPNKKLIHRHISQLWKPSAKIAVPQTSDNEGETTDEV